MRFVGHLRRKGGSMAAIWVRENGEGKGGQVHILMHIPAGITLRNCTRRLVKAAGGTYEARVSLVDAVGGVLANARPESAAYQANLDALLAYVLQGAAVSAWANTGLQRYGECGRIIGKRAGRTQNIGAVKWLSC